VLGKTDARVPEPVLRGRTVPPANTLFDGVLLAHGSERYPRTSPGERLNHLFEQRCDWLRERGGGDRLAVDTGGLTLTYDELDRRANQLARHLLATGTRAGDRVALLFDRPVYSYLGMLAVLKINAAYVPLDVGFPTDRIAYIVEDAGVSTVLTSAAAGAHLDGLAEAGVALVRVDEAAWRIEEQATGRLSEAERGVPADELAYIIYTSGSTGRPKGVAIDHPSICNFVRVAAEVYGLEPDDRIYQGLTIAFDFSFEEIWVPWAVGATLVPKPPGGSLLGLDLHDFLSERRVTAMCCVPTLLATVEDDLPDLRFLLVSGEACPQDLITRWHRPDRRFLNVYGPTEATVTATWTELHPEKPVTIGVPLPSYAIVILDVEDPYRALPRGEVGEIGIAGIGLARGYLNREDLTDKAFIPDFLGIPDNPSGRIYRTGDLGRVNVEGEIEYQGRIDLQVKIRGYRIELTEIESVLLQVPGIAAAVVDTFRPNPETTELVGYYSLRTDTDRVDEDAIYAVLRERLPSYMVPAYLEHLDAIPMTTSDKADRKNLPAPTSRRAAAGEHVEAATELERRLAEALGATLRVNQVSVTSHFFSDLGASSLVLAQFASRVRKQDDLPAISMKEIYQNPTVRQLAVTVGGEEPVPGAAPVALPDREPREVARVGGLGYVLCGAAQGLFLLSMLVLISFVADLGFQWLSDTGDIGSIYLRSLAFVVCVFGGFSLLPVAAKWLLVGRWRQSEFPLWGWRYLRFWLVGWLVRTSPMVLFAGSPLYLWYLRALGAKVGREVAVFSGTVPVVTDLLRIGDGTVIRRDCSFTGYRVIRGVVQVGPVDLGHDVVVGEKTVLDVDTAMEHGAQLGHGSSLSAGQRVPAGQSWHGTPARPADVDYRGIGPDRSSELRRLAFSLLQLLGLFGLGPLAVTAGVLVFTRVPAVTDVLADGEWTLGGNAFYLAVLGIACALFFGVLLLGIMVMLTVPRLLSRVVQPGKVYRLYGLRYLAQLLIATLTNSQLLVLLLGDSSFIVAFMRALGWRMTPVVQTGSNLGTQHTHDSPFLTTVGTGTMISDGLKIINMATTSTSFRVDPVVVGPHNFLGNDIAFPASAKVGTNVLLATKVMVPIDGPVRENVGLLGSPPFEIPRSTPSRAQFPELEDPEAVRRQLIRKNWFNAGTVLTVLLARGLQFFITLQLAAVALALYQPYRVATVACGALVILAFNTCYGLLLERAALGEQLRPRSCSIYDRYFWRHERLWKFYTTPRLMGTPFQTLLWRLAGVRIGKRVFDDGCAIPEKGLVTIGDDAVLNAGTVIQGHSLEDGAFASDYIILGAGATLGIGAFVHYGVTMGEDSVLDTNAFLMKGEEVSPHTTWVGNPAAPSRSSAVVSSAVLSSAVLEPGPPAELARAVAPRRPAREGEAVA
jgi:non-ribosomal peptide synthetase-like protein